MGQTEIHYGKLREVNIKNINFEPWYKEKIELKNWQNLSFNSENITLENWCKCYCYAHGIKGLYNYNETWAEQITDSFNKTFFLFNSTLYEFVTHKAHYGDDVYFAEKDSNGDINFFTNFYDGGISFSEAVEESLKTIINEN